jgi:hypothetical protein
MNRGLKLSDKQRNFIKSLLDQKDTSADTGRADQVVKMLRISEDPNELGMTSYMAMKTIDWLKSCKDKQRASRYAKAPRSARPVVDGSYFVEGEVISCKWKAGAYPAWKMVVKVQRTEGLSSNDPKACVGSKVWGTVPQDIDEAAAHIEDDPTGETYKPDIVGENVRFKAKFTRSDDDEYFGFFKGPREGEIL